MIRDHDPAIDYPWQTWEQDCKDRFPLGAGDTYKVGATGGEASHKLTIAEMPAHSHTVNAHNHSYIKATSVQSHTLTVNEIPSHSHYMYAYKTSTESSGYGAVKSNSFPDRLLTTTAANALKIEIVDGGHVSPGMAAFFVLR